ncbi:hypothetical protein WISP_49223 [Willisornis vidua]|uniref:Uncharacterized protein n=1 Tax=Willisornis vidua TaxID=1566151 RepID=A0ABQ9DFN9_9PASS|nr:hypothetical protein WISP_49223 [Willisornis vidua]
MVKKVEKLLYESNCEQPMEVHVEQMEQVAAAGGCDPVGSLCWSRLLAGPVDPIIGREAHAGTAEVGKWSAFGGHLVSSQGQYTTPNDLQVVEKSKEAESQ